MILDGAPLIAIHKARYYKRKDGLALGPGPFVTALEYAADCKATVVGKPEKTFFTQVRNRDAYMTKEALVQIGFIGVTDVTLYTSEVSVAPLIGLLFLPSHRLCQSWDVARVKRS